MNARAKARGQRRGLRENVQAARRKNDFTLGVESQMFPEVNDSGLIAFKNSDGAIQTPRLGGRSDLCRSRGNACSLPTRGARRSLVFGRKQISAGSSRAAFLKGDLGLAFAIELKRGRLWTDSFPPEFAVGICVADVPDSTSFEPFEFSTHIDPPRYTA